MCSSSPHIHKFLQPPEENSSSGFSQSNSLLNNRYRILKPLGQGGFGKTFLAIDEQDSQNSQDITSFEHPTGELCVIKQFLPQYQTLYYHQKASELFHQETLRLAQLGKHTQIPQLLDTFEQYLVQEWVDGQTLEQEFAQAGAFNEVKIRTLLNELLPVLQFVHAHQVIHRDLKPSNIIRRQSDVYGKQGQLFLVDFGAAKYTTGKWQQTGTLIGSAEYAAPEQIRGRAVFASDLYSLGVTCLHLLTQMSPFELYDCSEDAWMWRSYLIEPISSSLEKILCKLVQPATKLRYNFAAEVLLDLNRSPKNLTNSLRSSANKNIDDDFETPYFGLSREPDLLGSVTSFPESSIASVTIFDPKTKTWHYIPAKTEGAELARKVAAFLVPRLAAATPLMPEIESDAVSQKKRSLKLNKIYQLFLTAIAFTIASLIWVMETYPNTILKFEEFKIFQRFFNIDRHK